MKTVMTIMFISAILHISCTGQRINEKRVPSVVLNTLKTTYPFSTDVDWKKLQGLYEAEVDLDSKNVINVRIDASGKILMKKQDLPHSELLPAINAFIGEKYSGYTIDDLHKIENNGIIYYQVDLDATNKKDVQLVFSSGGKEEKNMPYWD